MLCTPCCAQSPSPSNSCFPTVKQHPVIFAIYLAAVGALIAVLAATAYSANIKMVIGCSAVGAHILLGPPLISILRNQDKIQVLETYIKSKEAEGKLDRFITTLLGGEGKPRPQGVVKCMNDGEHFYVIRLVAGPVMGQEAFSVEIRTLTEGTLCLLVQGLKKGSQVKNPFNQAMVYIPDTNAQYLSNQSYETLKQIVAGKHPTIQLQNS